MHEMAIEIEYKDLFNSKHDIYWIDFHILYALCALYILFESTQISQSTVLCMLCVLCTKTKKQAKHHISFHR